jgi:hypothetical protein
MTEATYRSRVDPWFLVILLAGAGFAIVAAGSVMLSGSLSAISVGLFLVVLGAGLPLWLLRTTRYVIGDRHLRVHSGPFRWAIALDDITSIEATRNPVSSPALSLDRLRIDYGNGRALLISPKDQDRFLRELEDRRSRSN